MKGGIQFLQVQFKKFSFIKTVQVPWALHWNNIRSVLFSCSVFLCTCNKMYAHLHLLVKCLSLLQSDVCSKIFERSSYIDSLIVS